MCIIERVFILVPCFRCRVCKCPKTATRTSFNVLTSYRLSSSSSNNTFVSSFLVYQYFSLNQFHSNCSSISCSVLLEQQQYKIFVVSIPEVCNIEPLVPSRCTCHSYFCTSLHHYYKRYSTGQVEKMERKEVILKQSASI